MMSAARTLALTTLLALATGCANLPPWASLRISIGWSTLPEYPPQTQVTPPASSVVGSNASQSRPEGGATGSDLVLSLP